MTPGRFTAARESGDPEALDLRMDVQVNNVDLKFGAGPVAVLVGAPGSGKSTVGQLLAEQLRIDFRDTDTDVEIMAGRTVAEIFVNEGESSFRELERQAVGRALAEHRGVLSLGGGAILDDSIRSLLADHPTIWLRVSAEAAAKRVGLSVARPLLLGNVRSQLVGLLRDRALLYEEVADLIVDTDDREPIDIVCELTRRLVVYPDSNGDQSE